MKIVDKILYIEFADFIAAGWSVDGVKKANLRNGSFWMMIPNPLDARAVLVQYETLRPRHKEKIIAKFGNPYEFIAHDPIKKLVTTDFKAQEFYIAYRYNDTNSLPVDHVQKYIAAASWLNMLLKVTADNATKKAIIKQELNLTIDAFYNSVISILRAQEIPLPVTYDHLTRKMKQYHAESYPCLIDWRFGNTQAKKVNDEVSESILFEMISHPNQYPDPFIMWKYNVWAKENDRKPITEQTVGNYRRRNEHLLISDREGQAAFNDKFIIQAKRKRPSHPLYLVEHDDNHTDMYFLDILDKTQGKHYKKMKAIIVVDSFNDLVLGFAYGPQITNDLIRKAYLNAMYYIKGITGAWYLPHEIKADRFGSKEYKPFYQMIGHYYDTPVGSKGRGFLEQFFGSSFFKTCLKAGNNNYSGNNITARNAGVNREVLELNKKDRPAIEDAPYLINQFFWRLRNWPAAEGQPSKQDEWLAAWNATPAEFKKPITDEHFLTVFGVEANQNGKSISITNRGCEPQINNVQYSFDLPFDIISQYIGTKVRVLYDPYNMDRVLLTNFKDFRCVATSAKYLPSTMADYKEGSRTDLNKILASKLQQVEYRASKADKRKDVLTDNNIDIEALLQAGVPIHKELKQYAEERYLAEQSQQERRLPPPAKTKQVYNPLDQM